MATIQTGGGQNKLPQPEAAHYSTFDQLSKHIYTTGRFGENQVCCVMNAITGDKIKIRNEHKLQTYTLSAPLMTPIYMEKDLFQVPRQAILPWNWEKIYQQPNIGEDVDATVVGTSVAASVWKRFLEKLHTQLYNQRVELTNATSSQELITAVEKIIKTAVEYEYIYSYGSLLNNMGCKMAALWKQYNMTDGNAENPKAKTFDQALEHALASIEYGLVVDFGTQGVPVNVEFGNGLDAQIDRRISTNEFLQKIRDDHNWELIGIYNSKTNYLDNTATLSTLQTATNKFKQRTAYLNNTRRDWTEPIDLARLWAYQLVNAEYFTNDKVDYIYSAELFRQYIGFLTDAYDSPGYFEWNGIQYNYDYLSAYYFGQKTNVDTQDGNYLAALFSYKRSLKYLDYFTGSKTRPLGVGDFNVNPDEQGRVNVIDITRKIQAQRFANAVNRIGRKAEDYAKSLFGVDMRKDMHTPIWLGSTRDIIRSSETENTGDAQINAPNAVTSKLESYGGNSQFEIEVDRDSIIVGIYFFDLERSYSRSIHRSFMHVNRYDMYNPYLQYTGDQEIKAAEYDAGLGNTESTIFGYVPAYEEFKQDFNEAQGGFVTALPGWTFIDGMEKSEGIYYPTQTQQGPDFIRQKSVEMDRYYNKLTGHSLANYFHFIIDFYNEIEAKRPMSYNPQIL